MPDTGKSVADETFQVVEPQMRIGYPQTLVFPICKHYVATEHSWAKLPAKVRRGHPLYGSGAEQVRIKLEDGLRKFKTEQAFEGVVHNLQRRWRDRVGLDARGAVALHKLK